MSGDEPAGAQPHHTLVQDTERAGPPSADQRAALAELSARHGFDLIGPPLSAETAEAA